MQRCTVATPCFSMRTCNRASPARRAAHWALRSPTRSQDSRMLARSSARMSRCNSPRAKIRTAGMRTPSSKYVRAIEFSDPRRHAAYVGPVRRGLQEGHPLAAIENRLHKMDIVAVGAGNVGIVDHEDVAGRHALQADLPNDLFHRKHAQPHERRHVELALAHQISVAVGDGAGEVLAFVDRRRVGALRHHQRHLRAHRFEGVPHDLERGRVHSRRAPAFRLRHRCHPCLALRRSGRTPSPS